MADWLKSRGLIGELVAEFFGTFVLILFGVGVVAQVVAGGIGNHDSIAWSWGLGVMLGVYVAGRVSVAHLNPAVTLALAVFKGFEWRKVLPYSLAQFLGAFVAALIVRWTYSDVLHAKDPFLTSTMQVRSSKHVISANPPRLHNSVPLCKSELEGEWLHFAAFLAFFRSTSFISSAIFLTEPIRRSSAAEIWRVLLPLCTNHASRRFSSSDQSFEFTTPTLNIPSQLVLSWRR